MSARLPLASPTHLHARAHVVKEPVLAGLFCNEQNCGQCYQLGQAGRVDPSDGLSLSPSSSTFWCTCLPCRVRSECVCIARVLVYSGDTFSLGTERWWELETKMAGRIATWCGILHGIQDDAAFLVNSRTIHTRTNTHQHTPTHTHLLTYTHTHTHARINTHTHTHINVHIHAHTHIHASIYISWVILKSFSLFLCKHFLTYYIYICIWVYIYMNIYMLTCI